MTEPRFDVGDPIWAFNGQPRVVTSMRWAKAMRREDAPNDHLDVWGWVLRTVHPDDPTCVGEGFENSYGRRNPDER